MELWCKALQALWLFWVAEFSIVQILDSDLLAFL